MKVGIAAHGLLMIMSLADISGKECTMISLSTSRPAKYVRSAHGSNMKNRYTLLLVVQYGKRSVLMSFTCQKHLRGKNMRLLHETIYRVGRKAVRLKKTILGMLLSSSVKTSYVGTVVRLKL